jgi:thymidine phosphorylase
MLLGAGLTRVDAPIDYGAGIMLKAKPGDRVKAGDELAELFVGAHAQMEQAIPLAASAYVIADQPPAPVPLVLDVVA